MSAGAATPKVSVIVPIYNQLPFIRETVESVLAQDYANVELVLSDDGSTDGTQHVLHEYSARDPERVKVVASEHNTGIAGAVDRALEAHSGEYIAWLGGDDVMLPGKLSRQVAVLKARPDVIGCCHDAEVFDSASGKPYGRFTEVYNGRRGVREGGVELLLDPGYLMLPSTMMVRSSAVGELRFDPRIRVSNDWLFDIALPSPRAQRDLSDDRRTGRRAGGPRGGRRPLPRAQPADPAAPCGRHIRRGQPAVSVG